MSTLSKAKWCLVGGLVTVVLVTGTAWLVPDRAIGAIDWLSRVSSLGIGKGLPAEGPAGADRIVEMYVERVAVSSLDLQPVIFLRAKGGDGYLQVRVGLAEARAIAIVLEVVSPPRPLTHDLLRATIEALGARVESVLIDDLREGIFYAKLIVSRQNRRIELDSRLSDALALALRTGTPIYAWEKLLERKPIPGQLKANIAIGPMG